VAVKLKVSPHSLNFGTVKVGGQKGPANITVSNPDPKKKPGSTVLMEGLSGAVAPFNVDNGCNLPLPPGGKCTIGVTFKPTAPGTFTATLKIIDNSKFGPQSVKLKGKAK
jgi:hypothetical protein